MDSEHWQKLWSLHDSLLTCSETERWRELDEIEAREPAFGTLLRQLLRRPPPAGFMRSSDGESDSRIDVHALIGTRVGSYEIRGLLGRGGLGVVYDAQQIEPICRQVAVKMIGRALVGHDVVHRFESERQVLALMNHSHIAKVFDAGVAPDGRPYFVMEAVSGLSIIEACDAERMTVRQRLQIFRDVCLGIQHAHQKGILHRDIKPSNVLVATEDSRAVAKIIDFGIAKALDPDVANLAHTTYHGLLVGTPEFMSPEQAALTGDVDVRSDIYALGALLYELLTGRPPIEPGSKSVGAILEAVRTLAPPAPSARVAQDEERERIARDRGTERHKLPKLLARELDWIVAKAMSKDREQRYQSASSLAEDIERFQVGEPLVAGPPSLSYRLGKLVRRHRLVFASAAVLLIVILAFTAAMTAQSFALSRALAAGEVERQASDRVAGFLVELLQQADPMVVRGEEVTVRDVLDRGAERVGLELGAHPAIQARLLTTIGLAYSNLGHYQPAATTLERALEVQTSMDPLSHRAGRLALDIAIAEFSAGKIADVESRAETALETLRSGLPDTASDVAECLQLVAILHRDHGAFDQAIALLEESIEVLIGAPSPDRVILAQSNNHLGIVHRRLGNYDAAESHYRNARVHWREAGEEDHPDAASVTNNLALLLHVRGDFVASDQLFNEVLPIREATLGPDHPWVVTTMANHAALLLDIGEIERAEAMHRKALAIRRERFEPPHIELAQSLSALGRVLRRKGALDEALRFHIETVEMRKELFGDVNTHLADALEQLARTRWARREHREAATLFDRVIAMNRETRGAHPFTARALVAAGLHREVLGDIETAEARLREAVTILVAQGLESGDRRLAAAQAALGLVLVRRGASEEARRLLEVAQLAADRMSVVERERLDLGRALLGA